MPRAQNSSNTPASTCYKCNRTGHWSKDCRANTKLDGTPINKTSSPYTPRRVSFTPQRYGSSRNTNAKRISTLQVKPPENDDINVLTVRKSMSITVEEDENSSCNTATEVTTRKGHKMNLVANQIDKNLIEHEIICNGVKLIGMIDTGSQVIAVSSSTAIWYGWKASELAQKMTGAGGKPLMSSSYIKADVELQINKTSKSKKHYCSHQKPLGRILNRTRPIESL